MNFQDAALGIPATYFQDGPTGTFDVTISNTVFDQDVYEIWAAGTYAAGAKVQCNGYIYENTSASSTTETCPGDGTHGTDWTCVMDGVGTSQMDFAKMIDGEFEVRLSGGDLLFNELSYLNNGTVLIESCTITYNTSDDSLLLFEKADAYERIRKMYRYPKWYDASFLTDDIVDHLGVIYKANKNTSETPSGSATDWDVQAVDQSWNLTVESFDISDFRSSKYAHIGRATAIINQEEAQRISTLMYTEPLIPNSDINNLNNVYPDVNFEEYNRGFGKVIHLHNEGDHLLMMQEDKISKVYVERSVIYDAQGNAQLLGTQQAVLSKAVSYGGSYGIHDARTFQSIGNTRYWLDPQRGAVLRLSASGIDEISRYGMKGWFADACKDLLFGSDQSAYSIYDVLNGVYIIRFVDDVKMLSFNEEKNAWISFIDFYSPKHGVYLNNKAYYITDDNIFELGDSTRPRNTEYISGGETAGDFVLQFPSNIHTEELKNYLALAIDGSTSFDVVIDTAIIEGTGQESTLLTTDFTDRETEKHAPFFRDVNTPKLDPNMSAGDWTNAVLFIGDTMKGKFARIKFTYEEASTSIRLFLAKVIVSKG